MNSGIGLQICRKKCCTVEIEALVKSFLHHNFQSFFEVAGLCTFVRFACKVYFVTTYSPSFKNGGGLSIISISSEMPLRIQSLLLSIESISIFCRTA